MPFLPVYLGRCVRVRRTCWIFFFPPRCKYYGRDCRGSLPPHRIRARFGKGVFMSKPSARHFRPGYRRLHAPGNQLAGHFLVSGRLRSCGPCREPRSPGNMPAKESHLSGGHIRPHWRCAYEPRLSPAAPSFFRHGHAVSCLISRHPHYLSIRTAFMYRHRHTVCSSRSTPPFRWPARSCICVFFHRKTATPSSPGIWASLPALAR